MGIKTKTIEQERISFFSGQQLSSADLNKAYRILREMRWLHNRSSHNWGIAFGLAVSGQPGDAQVTISPGFAINELGQEIILLEPQTIPVPMVSASASNGLYWLTITFPDEKEATPTQWRNGVCQPGGVIRSDLHPQIRWFLADDRNCRFGLDIILTEATVQNCRLAEPLSFNKRKRARPDHQSYVATGQTYEGKTVWVELTGGKGITTRVDTSSARFRCTPVYQAYIRGKRFQVHTEIGYVAFLGLTHVKSASPDGFDFVVNFPSGQLVPGGIVLNPSFDNITTLVNNLKWHVIWMGAEGR